MARLAGVSRATVSYVVNGVPDVKITPATRERVLGAAAQLGYSQFGPGRTLKSGRSDVVLFVLQDLPVGHALNLMLDELGVRLAAIDLSLVMFRVNERGNPLSRIWREIGPCAVIGMETINDAEAEEMIAAGIDVFRLNLGAEEGSGALTQSQLEVGETQVNHLVQGGRRRLGYAYPDDPRVEAFARLRCQGAAAAVSGSGCRGMEVARRADRSRRRRGRAQGRGSTDPSPSPEWSPTTTSWPWPLSPASNATASTCRETSRSSASTMTRLAPCRRRP